MVPSARFSLSRLSYVCSMTTIRKKDFSHFCYDAGNKFYNWQSKATYRQIKLSNCLYLSGGIETNYAVVNAKKGTTSSADFQ